MLAATLTRIAKVVALISDDVIALSLVQKNETQLLQLCSLHPNISTCESSLQSLAQCLNVYVPPPDFSNVYLSITLTDNLTSQISFKVEGEGILTQVRLSKLFILIHVQSKVSTSGVSQSNKPNLWVSPVMSRMLQMAVFVTTIICLTSFSLLMPISRLPEKLKVTAAR